MIDSVIESRDQETNPPDDSFPASETFVDCCGKPHEFALELLITASGYFVRATERVSKDDGYAFAAHSETDHYLALGRLRGKIHKGLATRYLAAGALPAALDALRQAQRRGVNVGDLVERFESREQSVRQYTAARQGYCWPVASVRDLRLAPFHVLATEGAVHADKDHQWHMTVAQSICIG